MVWWKGPVWLSQGKEQWPAEPLEPPIADGPDCTPLESSMVSSDEPAVLDLSKFSSLNRLLRTTAWTKRACRNFRRAPHGEEHLVGDLTLEELSNARLYWEKVVQHSAYPELRASKQGLPQVFGANQMSVFIDKEGLLRCKSRLQNSELPYDAQNPIVLPKGGSFTALVIAQAHENCLHAGTEQTLMEVRKRYWVIHGRNQVKKGHSELP